MKRKSIAITGSGLAIVAAVVVALVVGLGVFQDSPAAEAQTPNSMEARLNQIIQVLAKGDCATAETVIDRGMEVLYGGMRPLPTQGVPETEEAHQRIGEAELRFAEALREFAEGGKKGKCDEQRGRALDLKLFIEQMNEVAEAVGQVTRKCGQGILDDSKDPNKLAEDPKGPPSILDQPPCDELHTLLDEQTGHEIEPRSHLKGRPLFPSYSVKLRSPFVPPWFGTWEEDVLITEPIELGSCVVVFKETKGLMLRLHFERVIVVTDPWVATFGVPRGTKVPIWRLEWVPSQYVKEWNICNKKTIYADGTESTGIENTVSQRVKQDTALNFFWRFYPKTR